MSEQLRRGRRSFDQRAWEEAYTHLLASDRKDPLDPPDLERLATCAYLTGRYDESAECWTRAHHAYADGGESVAAAQSAFWLAFGLINRGEHAHASGWLARAERLLDDGSRDTVVRGFLLLPRALRSAGTGDHEAALAGFERVVEIAERFDDPDLATLALQGQGRALLRLEAVDEGVRLLDEAMIIVGTGNVSPIVVGTVYCSVIDACREIFDVQRAQEWTAALTRWCEAQPELVPFRGRCLVHRAEILQLQGAWPDAMSEAQRACEPYLRGSTPSAVGLAFYQRAELHRLRGEFAAAEQTYRQAGERGREPQPGLAQLWAAKGQVDAAASAIRRAMDEAKHDAARARSLPACVEISLAAGDVAAARAAARDLADLAKRIDVPLLHAMCAYAEGAVLLAEGDAQAALEPLRRAWTRWQELAVPYEVARVKVLVGVACRNLGDEESALLELEAARKGFLELGAAPDLARVDVLLGQATAVDDPGLTPRQLQVLRLVATGATNKAIAAELSISDRTVDRHMTNIFNKLGVSTRAAATAYAYEHQLL